MKQPKPASLDCDDLLTKHGAGLLADAVKDWWHRRGYKTVTVERYLMVGTKAWGVRSNLVSGLPPLAKALAERRAEFLNQ